MTRTKVAVVTGSNKGLGLAIVKSLCTKYDGIVYLTSRDEERGKNACKELRDIGLTPEFHHLDITDEQSIKNFCEHIKDKHKQIDTVINNAGILFLKDATEPIAYQAEQTVAVNFFALVNFTEAILPLVANGGSIINISSSSGHLSRLPSEKLRLKFSCENLNLDELKNLMTRYVEAVKLGTWIDDGWGDSPYVVSKVGVNAYTFLLHRRLADRDIAVNCYHPGYVISDMTRGAGSVTPDEAAAHAVRLCVRRSASGLFLWHDGTAVPWDGPDPRGFIDGKL